MDNHNTPKSIGGSRKKGEISEQGAKVRAGTISRVKAAWGVSEFIDIFPKEIRPKDDLGTSALTNLRTISNLCPDLKKAQDGMLDVCRNADGAFQTFSFGHSKALVEKYKGMKNQGALGEIGEPNIPDKPKATKKKGSTLNTPSAAHVPAILDSIAVATLSPSPVKAKKAKAQAASQALLKSIGTTSVEHISLEEQEGDSITVDTTQKVKPTEKTTALLPQDKPKKHSTATMTARPVAVMTTDEPHTESALGFEAPKGKEKPLKTAWINTPGSDFDSADSGLANMGINQFGVKPAGNVVNPVGNGPAPGQLKNPKPGRMVAPSKDLIHPFRVVRPKPDQNANVSGNANPPTGKPGLAKKPFDNLFTGTNKAKTFEPLKRGNQKVGDPKNNGRKMEHAEIAKKDCMTSIATELGNPDTYSNIGKATMNSHTQGHLQDPIQVDIAASNPDIAKSHSLNQISEYANGRTHHGNPLSPAEDGGGKIVGDNRVESTAPIVETSRTQLPSKQSKKRSASTMFNSSEEDNIQLKRSVRPRLDSQLTVLYSRHRAISDVLGFERFITAFVNTAMNDIPVSSPADAKDKKAEDSKAEYVGFMASFLVGIGNLKDRLLEIAEREDD